VPTLFSSQPLTEFDRFELPGDAQHKAAMALRAAKLALEKQQLADAHNGFHALPLPPTTFGGPSFVPQPSDRPPLAPLHDNVVVAGDKRSEARKAFDAATKKRLAAENAAREALVAAREAEAEEQYQALMAKPIEAGGLMFVAKDVHHAVYDGPDLVPGPSSAELTVPVTPTVLKRQTRSSMVGGAMRVEVAN
jgi:hypothetical protein